MVKNYENDKKLAKLHHKHIFWEFCYFLYFFPIILKYVENRWSKMSDDCCPLITRFTVQIQRKNHFSWTLYGKFGKRSTKQNDKWMDKTWDYYKE